MSQLRRRRIVLINPAFQLRLAALFMLVQILLTGIFAFGIYLFMESELTASLASAHAAYRTLGQMLMPIVLLLSACSLAVSTLCVTIFVTLLSHRIAGPLHRFKAVLDELGERRIPQHTRIRPDDQLQEISESLTRTSEQLDSDLEQLQSAAALLQAAEQRGSLEEAGPAIQQVARIAGSWSRGA
ncbi:MAG: hypothetical protein HY823_14195 [Acidobacteria bacterium]|nr:hypothetical protein [Acidobacteriota bacterium]